MTYVTLLEKDSMAWLILYIVEDMYITIDTGVSNVH